MCLFTVTFAVNLQAPLYDAYAAQNDMGAAAVTIAFAAYVAGLMPTLLFLGGLSNRIGRKPPIALALALGATATGILVIWPSWATLIIARAILGVGTGLATTAGTAYMTEILGGNRTKSSALAVTSVTSLGFGGGALATGISLGIQGPTLFPASFALLLAVAPCLALAIILLPKTHRDTNAPLLRMPLFPKGTGIFGISLALAWSVTGMTIAVVPLQLARNDLGSWSGLVIFLAIFTGFLCQPIAKRLKNNAALTVGLCLVPIGFVILLIGMRFDLLAAVLAGTCFTSAASYGFTYLAALAEISSRAPDDRARATAGLFIYAYAGFSVPVIVSGVLADILGLLPAMMLFAATMVAATLVVLTRLKRPALARCANFDQDRQMSR
ncbi:MFS transporter [Paracoccus amoyensis]|nr:MFS transporter [Paracoccus amoyensis]